MSNLTFRLPVSSSLAECLAKTVGFPGSWKEVPVITTSSACVSDGLIGLDDSMFKGLRFIWSLERSGISGGSSWTGSCGCGRRCQMLEFAVLVHGLWGLQPAWSPLPSC